MDTGKIMMGTALLLITIGLLAHPAGAAMTGTFATGELVPGTVDAGTVHGDSTTGGLTSPGPSGIATHPYERLNAYPVSHPCP
jgi:hypothetical protein